MSRDDLDALAQRYLAEQFDAVEHRLALDWNEPSLDQHSFETNERCHELSEALRSADLSSTMALARKLAPKHDEPFQRKLARRMIEAQLEAAVAELKAMEGAPLERPIVMPMAVSPAPLNPGLRVSAVAQRYADERKSRGKWTAKTALQTETIFVRIAELLNDPPINAVTKDDVRALGLDIVKLPANMSKRFPSMSARDVLNATGGAVNVPRLEARSVNKFYQQTRSLFAWAVEHDHIKKSPATILRDVAEGRPQDARRAFDDVDVENLFRFIEDTRPEPYGVWIPRIMAFTGCRMGEAAQLRKADVRQQDGLWVFDFNDDAPEKSLKTEGSARVVPVHPRLLELGLADFVRASEVGFLFPERVRHTERATRGNMDLTCGGYL